MSAKTLFGLGALAFWLPEIVLYARSTQELSGRLVTILLPGSLLLAYLAVLMFRSKRGPQPSAAVFMVLGVIFLGTLAMAIGATILGGGFSHNPGSALIGVLLGTLVPIYAFIAATYDGSLYALILVSVLMPVLHLAFERGHWIIRPKEAKASS